MNSFDDIKLGRKLGKGMLGTVYEARDSKGKKYAIKIEQIFKEDLIKNMKSSIWRDIEFTENIQRIYKNSPHFMQFYDYKFD